jgi:hypothetical protein
VKILSKTDNFFSAGIESAVGPCKSFSNSCAEIIIRQETVSGSVRGIKISERENGQQIMNIQSTS